MDAIKSKTGNCPSCQSPIEEHEGFRKWCPSCNWNLGTEEVAADTGLLARTYSALGRRYGAGLLAELTAAPPQPRAAKLTPAVMAAMAICGLVIGLGIASFLAGLWLLWYGWPNMFTILGSVLLIGLAWLQLPRMQKAPKDLLSSARHPELFALTGSVARAMEIPAVELIEVTPDYNASMSGVGWRQRPLLRIGLPFWNVLDPAERVALIAHEFAHHVNGDPARGVIVGTALGVLDHWISILSQDPDESYDSTATRVANFMAKPLVWLLLFVRHTVLSLFFRTSQRAEFYADYNASRVAGTDATTSLLLKASCGYYLHQFLVRQSGPVTASGDSILSTFRTFLEGRPASECERMSRVIAGETAKLDATHPPTAHRLDYLKAHRVDMPRLSISPETSAKIDRELESFEIRMAERLMISVLGER